MFLLSSFSSAADWSATGALIFSLILQAFVTVLTATNVGSSCPIASGNGTSIFIICWEVASIRGYKVLGGILQGTQNSNVSGLCLPVDLSCL